MSQPAPMITKDGRFAYEAAGDPGATPLIFLHGIGGAARAWRHQLAAFGGRFRAILAEPAADVDLEAAAAGEGHQHRVDLLLITGRQAVVDRR